MADVFQSGAYDADGNRSLCIFHRRWNQGVTSAGRNQVCKERDRAAGSSEVCGYYTHWREKGKFRCAAHDLYLFYCICRYSDRISCAGFSGQF